MPYLPSLGTSCASTKVSKIKPDLLHCTSNTAPLNCPVPLVLTLHDIIFLEPRQGGNKSWYQNMGWYYRRMVVPRILPQCRKIITVSRLSAIAYVRYCDYPRIKSQLSIMDIASTFIPCQRYHLLSISILIMTIIFFS